MSKWKIEHEEFDDTNKDGRRKSFRSDQARDNYSQRMKKLWSENRDEMVSVRQSKEFREKVSNTLKKNWEENPEYREKQTEHLKTISDEHWKDKHGKRSQTIVSEFMEVHGDKYDYSKVEYQGLIKPVVIICPNHGEFKQTPRRHLEGRGCPQCARYKNNINLNEVKELLEKGLSPKEIAKEMGRNYETILRKIKLIREK